MSFNARVNYTGDGSTKNFAVPFEYLDRTHVQVYVNEIQVPVADWASNGVLILVSAPANGTAVQVRRVTPSQALGVVFTTPSILRARDLNANDRQLLFIEQESADTAQTALRQGADAVFDARGQRIKSVADPVNDTDGANKRWVNTSSQSVLSQATSQAAAAAVSATSAAVSAANASSVPFQRRTSAVAMPFLKKLSEFLSFPEFFYADRSADQSRLDALAFAAKDDNRSIYIPGGYWDLYGDLLIDFSGDTAWSRPRTSISGQGQTNSIVIYHGTGRALTLKGGGSGSGNEAHQALTGFTIGGTNAVGSTGLYLDHMAWISLTDFQVTSFDKGIDGIDVEYLRVVQSKSRFNRRGVTITSRANQTGVTADANSSDANAHAWIACTIGNNSEYGALYTRPSSLTFLNTDLQYNGAVAPDGTNAAGARPGFGLKIVNPATQGGSALFMVGGYHEGNSGVADVWIRHDTPSFSNSQAVINIAAEFKRVPIVPRTTNFIALDFALGTGPFSFKGPSAFKNIGVSSTGPAVAFIGAQQRENLASFDMDGAVYTAGEEVDEYLGFFPVVTRPSATSGFTGSGNARWSRRWKTVTVEGTVTVNTYGSGAAGMLNVTLPFPVRSGSFFVPVQIYDSSAGIATIYPAVVIPGSNYFTISGVPAGDNRLLQFRVVYPID